MVRRSPAELYLKYLIVRHESSSDKQIADIARAQHLDPLGAFYIARLRRDVVTPVPFYPENKQHKASFRFLMAKGLFAFFWPNQHVTTALNLLKHPQAKELIEQMLLSRSPVNWIVGALQREGYRASDKAVVYYKSFFFNVDLVDDLEMRTLLRLRFQATQSATDPDVARMEAAYEKEAWSDPRTAVAAAPIRSLATLMTSVRMGLLPDNASLAKVLATARYVTVVRSIEAAVRNGQYDAERSQAYMSVAAAANTILESVGSPEEDFQSKLSSIRLQTEEGELPMLEDVSRGIHTDDIELPGGQDADSELTGESSDTEPGGGTGQTG